MGLMVHSLEGIPEGHHRDYYIYLLDYGWDEPLADAMRQNFGRMSSVASEQKNVVVIMHPDMGVHFSDEVFSWHSINGDEADKQNLLPALLVTNRHPNEFRRKAMGMIDPAIEDDLKLILFPLKQYCSTTTQFIELIQSIFSKIKNGKDLDDFKVKSEKKKGFGGALANSIILEPNFAGIGFSFTKFRNYLKGND